MELPWSNPPSAKNSRLCLIIKYLIQNSDCILFFLNQNILWIYLYPSQKSQIIISCCTLQITHSIHLSWIALHRKNTLSPFILNQTYRTLILLYDNKVCHILYIIINNGYRPKVFPCRNPKIVLKEFLKIIQFFFDEIVIL